MARKRMVHPDIWTDVKFLGLPTDEARLLWIGLMNFADDEGIFEESIITIKCQILPMSQTPVELIEDYMRTMVTLRMLERGQGSDGKSLLRFRHWHNYQKISHPTKSRYLFTPVQEEDSTNSMRANGELNESSLRPPSQYNIIKDNIVKDNIIKDKPKSKSQMLKEEFTFERFYKMYPRKLKRKNAESAFKKIPAKDLEAVFEGVTRYIKYWTLNAVEKDFIPYPATWLNAKQWNDELDMSVKQPVKKFKSDVDKEIYKRNHSIALESKRLRRHLSDAKDNAVDEVPNLLEDFKKQKENKPLNGILNQIVEQAKPKETEPSGK